jgi:hypothetical protein
MTQSPTNNQHMHNLMTIPPNIKPPREPAFWDPGRIDRRPGTVQDTQTHEVDQGHALVLDGEAVQEKAVEGGDEDGEAEDEIHEGTEGAVGGCAEDGTHGEDAASKSGEGGLLLLGIR